MTLTPQARKEVQWWITHIYHSQKFLHAPPITTIIYSDASLEGWGATDSISTIEAPWQDTDELMHINVLELTAAHLALTKLAKAARSTHIQLKMDNLTAIAYINKMGGTHSPECNHVSQKIWEWAIARDIWLSAAYIPGDSNVVADFHSRCFHENKEWALKETVFALLKHTYGSAKIDLFASSTNAKMPLYISWLPDPNAYAVDAFTISWQDLKFYAFPPFSLIPRVLAKIIQDKATGILIIPKWTTQSWFLLVLTSNPIQPIQSNPTPLGNFSLQGPTILTTTTSSGTPTTQETVTTGSSFIRNTLQGFGFITVSFNPHPGIMATWH